LCCAAPNDLMRIQSYFLCMDYIRHNLQLRRGLLVRLKSCMGAKTL